MEDLQKDTRIANRYGLDIKLYEANTDKICQRIEFANISSINIEGGTVFAHGGASHEKRVGFYEKVVGEFTLSTQILTNDLLCLMTGGASKWDGSSPIVFKNRLLGRPNVFRLSCDTVWQDKDGNVYEERLEFPRVRPRVAFGRKYSGEGDVSSVDIVFDVMQDAKGEILTKAMLLQGSLPDITPPAPPIPPIPSVPGEEESPYIKVTYNADTRELTIEGDEVFYDEETGELTVRPATVNEDGEMIIGGEQNG